MTISRQQMNRQLYYEGGEGIMSLDAGAPSIKYTGDIRSQMASAPDPMADMYDQFLNMKQEGTIPMDMDFESFKDLIREQAAYGGSIRQEYGLGSIVKKAVKGVTGAVKDIVSSDIGKAALTGAALFGLPQIGTFGGFKGLLSGASLPSFAMPEFLKGTVGKTGALLAGSALATKLFGSPTQAAEMYSRDPKTVENYLDRYYRQVNPEASEEDVQAFVRANTAEYRSSDTFAIGGRVGYAEGTDKEKLMKRVKQVIEEIESRPEVKEKSRKESKMEKMVREDLERRHMQDVTRSMKAYGSTAKMAAGIEGLPLRRNEAGVNELDLRKTGGFIPPVGIKEKADDIPAMLSNNEFVFTADAVRGMGNGDVERGAEKLYTMMKTLENGGKV